MKATESRIGNWIKHLTKEETVWSTQSPDGINSMPEGWYEPIPLTEEWLVKFGFEKIKFKNYKSPCYELKDIILMKDIRDWNIFKYCVSVGDEGEDVDGTGFILSTVKCVHQLQNLYFALTGEELELVKATQSS